MSIHLIKYVWSILIIIVFTSTAVYSTGCTVYNNILLHRPCVDNSSAWCCSLSQICGTDSGTCRSIYSIIPTVKPFPRSPAKSSLSSKSKAIVCSVSIGSIFVIIVCVRLASQFKHKQQRSHSSMVTSNSQRVRYPHQRQPVRKARVNVYVPSIYNISGASLITSLYETSPPSYGIASAEFPSKSELTSVPPSYEAATVNLPPLYTLTTQPPVTAMVEKSD